VATLRKHYAEPLPSEELYDLGRDPDEMKNLADDPAHAKLRAELRDMLEREFASTGDALLKDVPPPDPRALHLTEDEYWAWSREGAEVLKQEEFRARNR